MKSYFNLLPVRTTHRLTAELLLLLLLLLMLLLFIDRSNPQHLHIDNMSIFLVQTSTDNKIIIAVEYFIFCVNITDTARSDKQLLVPLHWQRKLILEA